MSVNHPSAFIIPNNMNHFKHNNTHLDAMETNSPKRLDFWVNKSTTLFFNWLNERLNNPAGGRL